MQSIKRVHAKISVVLPLLMFSVSSFAENQFDLNIKSGDVVIQENCQQIVKDISALRLFRQRWDGTKPQLPEVKESANQCSADVTNLLPMEMIQINNKHWLDHVGGFGNCHGSAMFFAKLTPFLGHQENMRPRWLSCRQIPYKSIRAGDLGFIHADDEVILHSFTVVTKNLTFTKNGHNGVNEPYQFMNLTDLADIYYSYPNPDEPNNPMFNSYRENLKNGVDCLRGDNRTISYCSEELSAIFTRFMRCESLDEMRLQSEFKTDPFNLKFYQDKLVAVAKRISSDKNQLLTTNSKFLADLNVLSEQVSATAQRVPTETIEEKTILQISLSLKNIIEMLDPASEVRRNIFPDNP